MSALVDDLRKRVAVALRAVMVARGVTQRRLAKMLEIAEPGVSRLLSGKGNPTLATLERVAEALGYRITLTLERIPGDDPAPLSGLRPSDFRSRRG